MVAAADAAFFTEIGHSFLSSQVLHISMFVSSVQFFMHVVILRLPVLLLPRTAPCMIIFTMSHLLSLISCHKVFHFPANYGRKRNFVLSSIKMLVIVRLSIQLIL